LDRDSLQEHRVRVKVCGVKRVHDALLAAQCGADAIGLLVGQRHASDDFIAPDLARDIARACPPYVSPVLVTHLADPREISDLVRYVGVAAVQLHADCNADSIARLKAAIPGVKLITCLHMNHPDPDGAARPLAPLVDAFILDTINVAGDQVGGTGIPHDWQMSREFTRHCAIPVMLAGGLHAGNVQEAIQTVRPFGVDANSGLKDTAGWKDPRKVAAFVRAAKLAFFAGVERTGD
jgi:phosphoribosylanthranilate isomerase